MWVWRAVKESNVVQPSEREVEETVDISVAKEEDGSLGLVFNPQGLHLQP